MEYRAVFPYAFPAEGWKGAQGTHTGASLPEIDLEAHSTCCATEDRQVCPRKDQERSKSLPSVLSGQDVCMPCEWHGCAARKQGGEPAPHATLVCAER